ncbi:hypothetical protein [Corynebacterium epidermidicanis]|uniref:Uncharacterized protein n=1 Tax=Corynebacterium epidermidicanis TaxID=1050174 RepID=A0A0G3GUY0_9CORY|nr:hypothetical protein [Corynebacterium epidermidicanis]AKK02627.1 hypothetical protein CEPID_03770 [Corynebacterium epidermidicanis]
MSDLKPTFTDVTRRDILARIVTKNDVPVLSVEEVKEDGTTERLMLLNKYDAKQLSAMCELYLQQIFSVQFNESHTGLSPAEMAEIFSEED